MTPFRSRVGVRRGAQALVLALPLVPLAAVPALAHGLSIGQSKIVQDGDVVRYELAVTYAELAKRVQGLSAPNSEAESPALWASELRASRPAIAGYVGEHVQVYRDRAACDDALEELDTVRHRRELFAVIGLAYRCPSTDSQAYQVRYDLFFDERSAADATAHANVVEYRLGGVKDRYVFEPVTQRLQVGKLSAPSPLPWVLLGGAGLLVIVGLGVALAIRTRRPRPSD